jgi:hypothetical protein
MTLPENSEVHFVIVENNHIPTLADARDHVLGYAIDNGFELLTFADDDEVVDKAWLIELLKERDAHDLDLVGSPVRVAPVDPTLSWWKRMICRAVRDINRKAELRSIQLRERGCSSVLRIATGSWMANIDFFQRTKLRFNTALDLAGGEDWRLYDYAKLLGAKTGWTPYAIAHETLAVSRLSLHYYYRRNRGHARTVFGERYRQNRVRSIIRLLGSLLTRAYKTIIALIMLPFNPGRAL